jgi:hypothetical protein
MLFQMVSNAIMFISSFVKIGQLVEKLKWTHTHRQNGDYISLFCYLRKKTVQKIVWLWGS